MKKPIKIILILLAILVIVLFVAWFMSGKKTAQNGETPTTFSNFFGINSNKTPGTDGNESTLTSYFTNGGTNGTGTPGGNGEGTDNGGPGNTQSSDFTSGPFTPGGSSIGGSSIGGSSIGGNGGTTPGNNNTGGTSGSGTGGDNPLGENGGSTIPTRPDGAGGTIGNGGTTNGPSTPLDPGSVNECSDNDLNIPFTPDDLARLRILQQRFSTVASYLHTQSDLDVLRSSYDSYRVKNEQLKELIAYCENTAPRITDPAFSRHVPTPYWHHTPNADNFTDSETYSGAFATPPITGTAASTITTLSALSASPQAGNTIINNLESWLRLNLW